MTAGLIAVYNFPYIEYTISKLLPFVDKIYLRFDKKGNRDVFEKAKQACGDKLGGAFESDAEWNWWVFREELMRSLDNVQPSLVLFPDEDEVFPYSLHKELQVFGNSDKKGMMFRYSAPLPTDDGRILFNGASYPTGPLMKAFKWEQGLSYKPYKGWTQVTNYASPEMHFMAESRILHYALWDEELRKTHKMNW